MTVRGVLFGVYFYAITIVCQVSFLPFLPLPLSMFRRLAASWCWLVLQGLRWIVGVRWEWQGKEKSAGPAVHSGLQTPVDLGNPGFHACISVTRPSF